MKFYPKTSTIFILLLILSKSQSARKGCAISVSDLYVDQPLILKPNTNHEYNNNGFYLPNRKDKITFSQQQSIELACPGSNVVLGSNSAKSETVRVKCMSGKFKMGRKAHRFDSIKCQKTPRHTARYTGRNCLQEHKEIEIGFFIRKTFLQQIIICFNEIDQTPLYSEFNLSKTLVYSAIYKRPPWIQGHFYNLTTNSLNNLYKVKAHRYTINKLLGLEYTSQKYVSDKGNMYLARGHLAAKTDFLYGPQQLMTFYFINTAPQWQTFNGGNWLRLENDIRKYANKNGLDLMVYTGTYGVATLPNKHTSKDVELYLYVNASTKYIPVPRLFWKIIYEPKSQSGAAFVGVNNPYVFDKSKDVICKDISYRYKWLTWKPEIIKLGYSYCCSSDDFRKVVGFPPFEMELLRASRGPSWATENYCHLLALFLFIKM